MGYFYIQVHTLLDTGTPALDTPFSLGEISWTDFTDNPFAAWQVPAAGGSIPTHINNSVSYKIAESQTVKLLQDTPLNFYSLHRDFCAVHTLGLARTRKEAKKQRWPLS